MGNYLEDEKARNLAEYLKQNTSLTELNLQSMSSLGRLLMELCDEILMTASAILFLENVGDNGAYALAEYLKENTTLIRLNLQCMSGLGRLLMELYDKIQLTAFAILFLKLMRLALEELVLWLSL